MANSIQQARNIDGSLEILEGTVRNGAVLLVDDMVDSKWTLTVASFRLRTNGSSSELVRYTTRLGSLAAEAGTAIVSGAARGIDSSAMAGALDTGGKVIGVRFLSTRGPTRARGMRRCCNAAANNGLIRKPGANSGNCSPRQHMKSRLNPGRTCFRSHCARNPLPIGLARQENNNQGASTQDKNQPPSRSRCSGAL